MPCPWPCGPRRSCRRCPLWSCRGRCRRTSSSSTSPGPEAPLLVSGNSEFTLTVLSGLLALTISPFYLLLVDTRGDTADMAMIYRSFTPQRLDQALEAHRLAQRLRQRRLIIPGVLAPLKEELAAYTGWTIRPGPICAAELPLFLGDQWQPPPGAVVP